MEEEKGTDGERITGKKREREGGAPSEKAVHASSI